MRVASCLWESAKLLVMGCTAVLLLTGEAPPSSKEDLRPVLEVTSEASGRFLARALLYIPAPPHRVLAVLTDYERWPMLFNGRIRIVALRREPDRVVTDLMIARSPLPGELRLLCETRTLPDGGLLTIGLDGDLAHYVRRWTLIPDPGQDAGTSVAGTRADVELSFELQSWVPDWFVRERLRQELLEHFETLQRLVGTNAPPWS